MEMLYQYLWKYRLLPAEPLTTDGRRIKVIDPGTHNQDAGPDFSGARIMIDGHEWVGNVEVHVKASDWFAHHHDEDRAYDNVILHFVSINDRRIPDGRGGMIPQLEYHVPEPFKYLYARLAEKINRVKCEDYLHRLSPLCVSSWLDTLAVERIQQKASRILDELKAGSGDWQRVCFIALARALGFSLNSLPLEMLARSVPLNILAKHSDNLMQLEAILFGQAGMLDMSQHIFDRYYQQLCREYLFLAHKYSLKPMRSDLWKQSKTRPQNFPVRRVALLAKCVYGGFSLMSRIIDRSCDWETAPSLFDWTLDSYWMEHLDFDKPGTRLPAGLSRQNINLLIINFVAPMLYAYGAAHGDPDTAERGLDLWTDTEAENNTYIRQWNAAGLPCDNAMESQALIQLRKEYCDRARCMECRFGHALLKEACSPAQRNSL